MNFLRESNQDGKRASLLIGPFADCYALVRIVRGLDDNYLFEKAPFVRFVEDALCLWVYLGGDFSRP